ncbi:MAG: hypothetical protein K1X85_05635 [Ignavibacteria bacterium]|nr:hypothetical protein [Ignavibacteria bacterium]
MVTGIEKFKEYFSPYPDSYIIIGGTACDMIMEKQGLTPRATKDFDIVLIIDKRGGEEFFSILWKFIKDGNYKQRIRGQSGKEYFRFSNPSNEGYPAQLELFSRNPGLEGLSEDTALVPIPLDDELESLSAILLDDEYYGLLKSNSYVLDELRIAGVEALICLKAKAYLDLSERSGQSSNAKKQKNDVFRLGALLESGKTLALHADIKNDLKTFFEQLKDDHPGDEIYIEFGLKGVTAKIVADTISNYFELEK